MSSPDAQRRRNREWVARQPGSPELSAESRAISAAWPDLHVRVWCNIAGVNVLAYIDRSDGKGRLHRTEVAKATFRGKPPTEEDVVLWALRALSTWIEARILELGEAELTGA